MYLVKMPRLVQALMPSYIWTMPASGKQLYLTFDDGPIPNVTPWVLETLRAYEAKATFFCVGENVQRHPDIFKMLVEEGHAVGNHTFNHLNGWHQDNLAYIRNVRRCSHLVDSPLFRPPYGRIRPAQRAFLERHYRIVMWDVLSGDFDPRVSPGECLQNVVQHAAPGSIIVMHDSLKSEKTLRFVLPRVLEHFTREGFRFTAIPVPAVCEVA